MNRQDNAHSGPASPDRTALLITNVAGNACSFGWLFLTAFNLLTAGEGGAGAIAVLPCMAFFAGAAALTCTLRFSPPRFEDMVFTEFSAITIVFSLAGWAVPIASLFFPNGNMPLILALAAGFLSGTASSWFLFAWNATETRLNLGVFIRNLTGSILGGNLLFLFAFFFVGPVGRAVFSLCLITASGAALSLLRRDPLWKTENPIMSASKPKTVPLDYRIRILFFVFGIAFGVSWALLIALEPDLVAITFAVSAAVTLALLIALRKVHAIHDRHVTLLIRASMVVLSVCFLILAIIPKSGGRFALPVICVCWQLFLIFDLSLLMRHVSVHGFSTMRHIAIGRLSNSVGLLVGLAAGAGALAALGVDAAVIALSALLTATVVIAVMTLFPFENRTSPSSEADREDQTLKIANEIQQRKRAAEYLAKNAGLSSRETEILTLIVQGHSNRSISEMLFISENTTKTHVYNTYRKLGVHSRQEVLDLVADQSQYASNHLVKAPSAVGANRF